MQYTVRKAQPGDLPRILEIYAFARKFMAENGNPTQWGTDKPGEALLRQDILRQRLQVVTCDGMIHGVFYFFSGEDPTYRVITQGHWLSDEPYGTIHRIAADGSGGVFGACLKWCLESIPHLRIDTHRNNLVMQHVVEKHGFSRRGIIFVEDGTERIAYERL